MVMIPVGNKTSHSFKLWCFAEFYIRVLISAVVISHIPDLRIIEGSNGVTSFAWYFVISLFIIWCFRPIYLNLRSLYFSWRDAKHRAECDELGRKNEA